MKEEIKLFIEKARRSLEAAGDLHKGGHYDFAISRAYYAMFYMATALLLTRNLSFSKHSAIISALNQHFVEQGILDQKYHRMFSKAFEARQIGDYGILRDVSQKESREMLSYAKDFVEKIEELIGEKS